MRVQVPTRLKGVWVLFNFYLSMIYWLRPSCNA